MCSTELWHLLNALFKSSGVIYWSILPSLLPDHDELSKDDSGFFSTLIVCVVSYRSNKIG